MDALWLALGVVFVAELGDKSQLMTLTFAARYRPLTVFVAISLATAVIHGVSVTVGELVSQALPTDVITIVAGVAFLGFAAWTFRDGDEDEDEEEEGRVGDRPESTRSPVVVIGATFFLAEFGDKTMLASMTLASTNGWLGTWIGATVGMVAANVLAIVVGAQLGARLPMRMIRIGSAVVFAVFGVVLIVSGVA